MGMALLLQRLPVRREASRLMIGPAECVLAEGCALCCSGGVRTGGGLCSVLFTLKPLRRVQVTITLRVRQRASCVSSCLHVLLSCLHVAVPQASTWHSLVPPRVTLSCLHVSRSRASTCHDLVPPRDTLSCLHCVTLSCPLHVAL